MKASNFIQRAISAIILAPITLWSIYEGSWFFFSLISIAAFLSIFEMYRMLLAKSIYANRTLLYLFVLPLFYFFYKIQFVEILISTLLFIVFVFLSELYNKRENALLNLGGSFFIYSYILLCFGSLIACREYSALQFHLPYHEASFVIFTVVICVWFCDTFAYLGGSAFGKHRLMPRVSPKKSIEGSIIGFSFSLIAAWFSIYLFQSEMDRVFLMIIGVVAGIFGQYGDLVESLLKRDAGVKDSGSSIPGHGGILDRIDSILFLSPLIFALLYLYPKYFQ